MISTDRFGWVGPTCLRCLVFGFVLIGHAGPRLISNQPGGLQAGELHAGRLQSAHASGATSWGATIRVLQSGGIRLAQPPGEARNDSPAKGYGLGAYNLGRYSPGGHGRRNRVGKLASANLSGKKYRETFNESVV